MRTKISGIAALCISFMAVLSGCGGGGGATTHGAAGTVISGTASKGAIAGGTIKVFQIISSATLNPRANIPRYGVDPVAQGSTGADGSYSVTLPAGVSSGSLLIQVTGGSYTDEATGSSRNVADQYGAGGMRAIVGDISAVVASGGALSASVTPYTEIAVENAGPNPTDHDVSVANGKIAAAFNLPDIVATRPLDPNQSFPATGGDDGKRYALALATISQYQNDYGAGATLAQIGADLSSQLAGGGLSPQSSARIGASSNNYAGGSRNPNPGLLTPALNPNAPSAVHSTPSAPLSVSIGSSVTISAHVVKSDNSVVPDGTVVRFTCNFGTLSAGSAGTVNGFASVTLSSATVGSASVTASSGAASDSVASISFVDPNAAASITLSASAGQGISNGAAVVISANVSRAAGGPVPDGTVVSFTVVSGSGSLTGATSTSGGIASVNLTSSVANASVGVRASAGGVSQVLSVPFIHQPTKAIVKVATGGSLPPGTLIGGIAATVNYAAGKGLSIVQSGVAVSGNGAGSTLIPNTNNQGVVVLGLLNVGGIGLGEFATLSFDIAAGSFPSAADFSIAAGSSAIDVNTVTIPGVSAGILSVTIQ